MHEKLETLEETLMTQLSLAGTYWEDGAPASAARCLRKAAQIADQYAQVKSDLLTELHTNDQ